MEVLSGVTFTANGGVLLDGPTTINTAQTGTLVLNGVISSSGPGCSLIKNGSGELELGGSASNTYSGETDVNAGSLFLIKNQNLISVPGNLTIGPGPAGPATFVRLLESGAFSGNTVTINNNAFLDLFGNNVTVSQLNLNDGGSVQTGSGTLSFTDGSTINVGSQGPNGSHFQSSISGIMLFIGGVTANVALRSSFAPFFVGAEFEVAATISGGSSSIFYPFNKYGAGEMELDGHNTYYHGLQIFDGVVVATNSAALGNTTGGTFVNGGGSLALLGGVTISGESLTLASTNASALDSRSGSNTWTGPISLNQPAGINVAQGSYLQVLNTVSGPGGLTKSGPGDLQFWGFSPNSYGGVTTVSGGVLEAGRVGLTSIPGDVVVGDDTTNSTVATIRTLREQQFATNANFTIHTSGLFDVFPFPSVPVPTPLIGTLAGAGLVNLGAGTTLTVSNSANCTFSGVIGGPGAFKKAGSGTLQSTGAITNSGTLTLSAGALQLDGTQSQSTITISGGTLQGTGTVGTIDPTSASGSVAPGDGSPGILTCGNFGVGSSRGGTFKIKLNGAAPGSGYSQLDATGTISLSSGLNHMSFSATLGFASPLNSSFTLIKNLGSHAVAGTFSGLAEGGTVTIGSEQFRITYSGGGGNDVVLTQITGQPIPTLSIQQVPPGSVRLLWPTNEIGFSLYYATNLANPVWQPATPPPVFSGTNNVVTNSADGSQKFYRLSNP